MPEASISTTHNQSGNLILSSHVDFHSFSHCIATHYITMNATICSIACGHFHDVYLTRCRKLGRSQTARNSGQPPSRFLKIRPVLYVLSLCFPEMDWWSSKQTSHTSTYSKQKANCSSDCRHCSYLLFCELRRLRCWPQSAVIFHLETAGWRTAIVESSLPTAAYNSWIWLQISYPLDPFC